MNCLSIALFTFMAISEISGSRINRPLMRGTGGFPVDFDPSAIRGHGFDDIMKSRSVGSYDTGRGSDLYTAESSDSDRTVYAPTYYRPVESDSADLSAQEPEQEQRRPYDYQEAAEPSTYYQEPQESRFSPEVERRQYEEPRETPEKKLHSPYYSGLHPSDVSEFDKAIPEISNEHHKQRVEFQVHGLQGPHSYRFGYDTGKGYNRQFRYEERDNYGNVRGRYGFYDKHGELQIVNYSATPKGGFHAEGDFGQYPNKQS